MFESILLLISIPSSIFAPTFGGSSFFRIICIADKVKGFLIFVYFNYLRFMVLLPDDYDGLVQIR